MGILGDIVRRELKGDDKKEDFYLLYNKCTFDKFSVVDEGKYNGHDYKIGSYGKYPGIIIYSPIELSPFAGKDIVNFKDRNGKLKPFVRSTYMDKVAVWKSMEKHESFEHMYCDGGDFVMDFEDFEYGHRYTIKELKSDVMSVIDQIIKERDDYFQQTIKKCK